ncbi:GTP cyclohydrolase-2 [Bosea sp. 62]|uniref:GTP cyclohydrolase II RibA n=1 Tax=unclassified Bosea (in: a-proteobacteria) TaxID=2653178 RepID=UPI001258F00E|nr:MULTISPECIES: GTP cyclohydrolase II RibA [unclassified Bosea (in: a-proteobacteria)]CAD5247782.1 GTP cyclohydrolase-2 [Bosea sp. 46]CAD5249294.1 GTP cyclohydrolase-2 [Bosea sp. 21B]CAD5266858.1 GTP cyclohydrolase-2 [Bosea sp. 7B]VVT45076.1 GTP cyclohydrolase-2 [Bosea sp. EC-HK365B]VXA99886.1 GTP cyclohydrolase-2 [Bosea sp. 29B]
MPQSRKLFDRPGETDLVAVDRALAEFRAARPVLLRQGEELALALSAELAEADLTARLDSLSAGKARLVLSAARLRRLGAKGRAETGILAMPAIDLARIETLALKIDARVDAPVGPAGALDNAALELARLALVLPAVILVPVQAAQVAGEPLIEVSIEAINGYRTAQVARLAIVGRAPVPLEGAPETEFVVFRGGEGLRDQVAIIVGKPDLSTAVPVRLHSACLTGDLFGSLKCDCGDQLRETVQWMAENEGGILLYLDQEGRGNGISNKMRAYKLQSQGWDTYDADEVLGFDLDQRHFDFAAAMLKQLGVSSVTALTNNPLKIGAIKAAGLEVAATQRVLGRPNVHNVRYLASKRDRAGHFIDMDALMARAAPKD